MANEEAYLETFVENLSTFPQEIRRNMDLIRDLDACSSDKLELLKQLHQQYIHQAEDKLMGLELTQREDGSFGIRSLSGDKKDIVVPTTYDLLQFVQDADLYQKIKATQEDCVQKSDEKVFVAQQALDRIDAVCQQLDEDMERMVETSGGSYSSQELKVANPDDLAAAQVTPGAEWILAKVIHHDPQSGMFKLADEDVESSKTYTLPENQVVVLTMIEKLRAGDRVFAVYPDTTSFYEATVVQAPRKTNANPYVMVTFLDDSDEQGITHEKFVPLKHTMLPPYVFVE